jgi:hypothetical protein
MSMMGQAAMSGTYQPTSGMTTGRNDPDWGVWTAAIMVLAGLLNAIRGGIALVNDDWAVWDNTENMYVGLTTWGWLHLVVGLAVLVSGCVVLTGNMVARIVGIIAATCNLMLGFLAVPLHPVWSLLTMALDVLIIWTLTVRGSELARRTS